MAKMNIEKFSLKELVDLEKEIRVAIGIKQAEEKETLKAQMKQMVEAAGLSLDDLFGGKKGGRKGSAGSTGVAKYRNPDNPAETWTGRGRRPQWLLAKLAKKGVSVEDFAI